MDIPSFFKPKNPEQNLFRFPHITFRREEAAFWSMGILAVFCAALVAWSGYLFFFYTPSIPHNTIPISGFAPITQEDINGAIQVLDEREARIEAILQKL